MNYGVRVAVAALIMLCQVSFLPGQSTGENTRVFLLGNTADIDLSSKFYVDFPKMLPAGEKFTVLINGDLVSGKSGKNPSQEEAQQIEKLLRPLSEMENARIIILPGDRDWQDSGKHGDELVNNLEDLVKSMDFDNVDWVVKKGCPGPDMIEINEHLSLVTISTQWFNHPYDKPSPASTDCKYSTERDFLIELENLIEDTEDKNLLVAGHYPLVSLGEYGGHFPTGKHLSPPVIGSFRVGYRQNIGTSRDIVNEHFDFIRNKVESILNLKGSVIYAAGHERNLQIVRMNDDTYTVNSGSPTRASFASYDKNKAVYSKATAGLVELNYLPTGKVNYQIHKYSETNGFSSDGDGMLFSSNCEDPVADIPDNGIYAPCGKERAGSQQTSSWPADTILAAGDYAVGGFGKLMIGKHYRTTWDAEVEVPYLDLDNTFGGLTVYEKGGGHQTTSLKIKGGDGKEYVFRSVDKDPTQLLPYELQGTLVSRALQDVTSFQQPYGAIAVGSMLDATDILHARPKLYMMPPSDDLGPFKNKYGNLFGMLEEKPKNVKEVEVPFAGADEILQSRKMFKNLYEDHDHQVNAKEYAKARMFDILIGDWGKHEDNWKWAGYETGEQTIYRPIPRDRDYVFSLWDGLLPYLADRKWGLPNGETFGYKLNDVRSLTFSAQPADRRLLNELTREDWEEAAQYIQDRITDEVIERGVKSMPAEIYDLSGTEIIAKLKQRKKDLQTYAHDYYENLIYGGVEVVGTQKKEYFEVVRKEDGTVRVSMFNVVKGGEEKGMKKLYERTFYPKEVEEIRLYGLGGEDQFSISGEAKKSILIRVVGGPEPDDVTDESFVKQGGKKTMIYERANSAEIDLGKEAKMVDTWNKALYSYDRHRYGYNRYLPIAAITYNSRLGLGLLGGVQFTNYKATKEDYSSKHSITGFVTTENVKVFKYSGRFHHVINKWDVQLSGIYADENIINNFFGIGNGTLKSDDLDALDFYDTHIKTFGGSVGLIKDFWRKSYFSFDLNYENNETMRDEGTIIAEDSPNLQGVFGLDDANLVELRTTLDIDFRDRPNLPEKGTRLFAKFDNGFVTTNDNDSYGIAYGYLEQYFSTKGKKTVTLALKGGGSTTYGTENIPFYKLPYLGQNSSLRGYDNNRFTGESTAFINSELRIQLADFKTSLVPMKFGVKGFYDTGRVFSDFDENDTWHAGYGFGLYLVPLTESFAVSISAGFSEEESGIILLGIGSTFR